MAHVKEELHQVDKMNLWDWHLPEIAAAETQIKDLESYLGFSLDPQYKSFLTCANGWKSLYHDVDLFGTECLMNGDKFAKANDLMRIVIESCDDENFAIQEILPIAVSNQDIDVFIINNANSSSPGIVTWFAGYKIDTFLNFEEFFMSMIEYNKRGIIKLKKRFSITS